MPTGTASAAETDSSSNRVLGPGAALRRGEAAAARRDRAALDAVRGRHLHVDLAVAAPGLVDLGRAQVDPELGEVARDAALDPDVIRLVVPRPVPREVDRRELVEGELPVRPGIAARAAGRDARDLGGAFGEHVGGGNLPPPRRDRPAEGPAEPEAAA